MDRASPHCAVFRSAEGLKRNLAKVDHGEDGSGEGTGDHRAGDPEAGKRMVSQRAIKSCT